MALGFFCIQLFSTVARKSDERQFRILFPIRRWQSPHPFDHIENKPLNARDSYFEVRLSLIIRFKEIMDLSRANKVPCITKTNERVNFGWIVGRKSV